MTDHCCAHPKCPGGSLCCCQGQPDPIERGAEALWNRMLEGLPETSRSEWRPWNNESPGAIDWHQDAHAVFDSIDVKHLTAVILRTQFPGGIKVGHADKIAHTIKNWLTGKDTQ